MPHNSSSGADDVETATVSSVIRACRRTRVYFCFILPQLNFNGPKRNNYAAAKAACSQRLQRDTAAAAAIFKVTPQTRNNNNNNNNNSNSSNSSLGRTRLKSIVANSSKPAFYPHASPQGRPRRSSGGSKQ